MQRVKARCWKNAVRCKSGEIVEVFFTISDFYEGRHLSIHPSCGTIFAVDQETEHYQRRDFQRLKHKLDCPECGRSLDSVLPYPEYFQCPSTGEIERYNVVPNESPADRAELLVEFWDPLT
jgi:hypothetical protein